MTHTVSHLILYRTEEKRYMVLMIVSSAARAREIRLCERWKIWAFTAWITCRVVLLPDPRSLADRNISAAVSIDVRNMPESPEIFEQAMQNLPECFLRSCCS